MIKKSILFCLFCIAANQVFAQVNKKWEVNEISDQHKLVNFTTTEGTWMNLDISPDGKKIVFDLLGDIYMIPINGGKAQPLRTGLAMDLQPKFSPDGKKILFTSDAGGGDNIWVMNSDGSNPHAITNEQFRLLNNAAWMPDGQYIVARKHFTSTRSLGAGEMWLYHISGGKGLPLTARKNDQQDVNEPEISKDGRFVYFSEDMYPGGYFQYNKDPNNPIFYIRRYDKKKGIVEDITSNAARPQLSRDGRKLAFIRRVRTKTVLFIRELATGEEYPIYDKLSKDQMEAWTIFGIYPRFAWTPDDNHIIIWSNGQINKVNTQKANAADIIPFSVEVKQHVADAVRFHQNINQDSFDVHVIRQASTSPNGKWLVFQALGHLYKKALPNGKPTRITNYNDFEFEPSFSKDGSKIVFTTWNDEQTGSIQILNIESNEHPIKITTSKGIYRTPKFSNSGNEIVFVKENGNEVLGNAWTANPGIYWLSIGNGKEHFVTKRGENPSFNKTDNRIFYQLGGGLSKQVASCDLSGKEEQIHIKSTYGSQFTISPDEQWIAFIDLHQVYVATFPQTGKTFELGSSSEDFPVKKVSQNAGLNLHWSKDSKKIMYTLGNEYFQIPLKDRFSFIAGIADSNFKMPTKGIDIGLKAKTEHPNQIIALKNAKIITMNSNEIIEHGTIVIENNLIKSVGKNEEVKIPSNAYVVDVTGKTILPGFIDAHAHGNHFRSGITPQKHWPYYANLAYGVTTMHDPSANSEMVFAQSELIKAGLIVGPRVFSTGTILYGADGDFKAVINNLEDAKIALTRTKSFGAFSVKSYNQPRREQRQQIIKAARELKMEVVPEGGSFFFHNLSMILDGHTTIEHNMPISMLYDDVVQLWKHAKTAYTPTLIVSYGAVSGEYYWYQHTNVWEKERLLRFTPRSIIDARSRHRTMIPEEEFENGHILVSKHLKKLNDAGVIINMGAHGQIQGIGAHWEIWMMQQGGMSNFEALKTATINPAISLGLDKWIGSLEKGKLADLIVCDKNPLEDIRNTESILFTMINGHLYDAEKMKELNSTKTRTKFFWENNKNSKYFNWVNDSGIESHGVHCICGHE